MLLKLIRQLNWVDISIIILAIRICYVAAKRGFIVELFKLLGTVTAIYMGLHYYTFLASYLRDRFNLTLIPLEFLAFFCFVILALTGYLVFLILRQTITRLIKSEAAPRLNQWGGLFVGALRGLLFLSILTFGLVISTFEYLNASVHRSYFGPRVFMIAPDLYTKLWDSMMSKFMSGEEFNTSVNKLQDAFRS